MATKHLDLEEQEQLEELKHFWKKYGNLILVLLLLAIISFSAWFGNKFYQDRQSAQAAIMYNEVEHAVQSGDAARIDRALGDMKDKFASTTYAQQAGLLAARAYYDKDNVDASSATLAWVASKAADEGYQAVAKLRLAGILLEKKSYDDALKQLSGSFPKDFAPLAADRRGDILVLQGKPADAKAEYEKAWKGLDERAEYRRLVEVKLNALGVDPTAGQNAATAEVKK